MRMGMWMSMSAGRAGALALGLWAACAGAVQVGRESVPGTQPARPAEALEVRALATPDPDYQAKWDDPMDVVGSEYIRQGGVVRQGSDLFLLAFVSGPRTGEHGEAKVSCDFELLGPGGSHHIERKGVACLPERLDGDPDRVYLSSAAFALHLASSDKPGKYFFTATVHDLLGGGQARSTAIFVLVPAEPS